MEVAQRIRVLVYCATAPRLEPEVVEAIFNQEGVSFYDVVFTRDNPFSADFNEVYKNIQMAYEKARKMVIDGGYQKLWVVESDTIPPLNALSKLMSVKADIVSGLYALRHGTPLPNVNWPDTKWSNITKHWGETIEMKGGCMGCLLVDRKVLEKVSFKCHPSCAPDVPFMEDCLKLGFTQMIRLDVVCGHKRPNGEIIWPENSKTGYRIEKAA